LQGPIKIIPVHLLPFQEVIRFYMFFKLRQVHKIIVLPMFFLTSPGPGSSGNGKGQIKFRLVQQIFYDGRFSTSRRCGKNNQLTSLHYKTLSICSFIFSNSSFICTTSCCIGAKLAFEPMVMISLPISWQMNPNFLPLESSDPMVVIK